MIQIDDLWLASYLITQGAELAGVSILPYASGPRLRAVFELQNVCDSSIQTYTSGDPTVNIHALRTAINDLRDLMYRELEKKNGNGGIKQMPNANGQRSDGQRRRGENENRSSRNRRD